MLSVAASIIGLAQDSQPPWKGWWNIHKLVTQFVIEYQQARCAETLVLLDGAHALGQVPIQLAEAGVDAYATWSQLGHSGTWSTATCIKYLRNPMIPLVCVGARAMNIQIFHAIKGCSFYRDFLTHPHPLHVVLFENSVYCIHTSLPPEWQFSDRDDDCKTIYFGPNWA